MYLNVNNITLNYIKKGKGKPVVLLHGNGEDHHIFDELTDKLKQNFTVYAIDSRNHGGSTITEDYSYETMAEDIFQFIQNLDLKNVSIIGFSDGAIIALLLAMEHKNIFKKMVLLGVNLKPSDFKKEVLTYLIEEYEKTKDPLIKMMLEQPDIELEELKNIQIPTFVIAAEDDIFYEKGFRDIVKIMPNATLKIMDGHDHASYITHQDILYRDLKEFLE